MLLSYVILLMNKPKSVLLLYDYCSHSPSLIPGLVNPQPSSHCPPGLGRISLGKPCSYFNISLNIN